MFFRGGITIPQTDDAAKGAKGLVCSNASCGRPIVRPLKTILIGSSSEPFDACPYCLTKVEGFSSNSESVEQFEVKSAIPESSSTVNQGPAGCKKHFGYLSERETKEQIPDECLTCKDIVRCMLKKAQ